MMTRSRLHAFGITFGVALATVAQTASAQVCYGTPNTSNVSYSFEQLSVGSSNGGTAALVGRRFAAAIDGRYRSIASDRTGLGGSLRLSPVLGGSRLSICPGIRIGLIRDTWDVRSGLTATSNTIGAGAGVNVGYEFMINDDFSIAPFGGVGFGFNALVYQLDVTNSETDVTGDTLSGLTADYGVMVQYSRFYAGFIGNRAPGSGGPNPSAVRYVIGLSFGDRRTKK